MDVTGATGALVDVALTRLQKPEGALGPRISKAIEQLAQGEDGLTRRADRAAQGLGSHIGGVGLGKKTVQRHVESGRTRLPALLEGERTAKGNVAAEFEKRGQRLGVKVEAVHDAASFGDARLAQDGERVVMSLAQMQAYGKPVLLRHLQLRGKDLTLHVARAEIVMVIESHLAQAARPGTGKQGGELVTRIIEVLGVVRMHAAAKRTRGMTACAIPHSSSKAAASSNHEPSSRM